VEQYDGFLEEVKVQNSDLFTEVFEIAKRHETLDAEKTKLENKKEKMTA